MHGMHMWTCGMFWHANVEKWRVHVDKGMCMGRRHVDVEHVDRWHGHVERWHREDWMGRTGRERRCSIGRSDGLIETRAAVQG